MRTLELTFYLILTSKGFSTNQKYALPPSSDKILSQHEIRTSDWLFLLQIGNLRLDPKTCMVSSSVRREMFPEKDGHFGKPLVPASFNNNNNNNKGPMGLAAQLATSKLLGWCCDFGI